MKLSFEYKLIFVNLHQEKLYFVIIKL